MLRLTQKHIHALYALKFKKWLLNFEEWYTDKYINDYCKVKPGNIIKLKHYIICMDWAFTKPDTVRPRFLPYHPVPHNIQSSNSGESNMIRSEIVANPFLSHNFNKTCKRLSISVVVSIKYRWKTCGAGKVWTMKFWPHDTIWLFLT